jgi:menaquinol-cytochrome c reductase iron-sulfur subunit
MLGGRSVQIHLACHSGSFTADGERIAGLPPRSMDILESKVEGGMLKVRYQYFANWRV